MSGKKTPITVSFNAGELSPRLDVRTDIDRYAAGCRILQNAIPLVEGGVQRTPGTYYVTVVKGDE